MKDLGRAIWALVILIVLVVVASFFIDGLTTPPVTDSQSGDATSGGVPRGP
jgi:hypothetical protein